MSQYAYPEMDDHIRQHRAFVVKTTELLAAARQGDEALPDKVLEYLRYWLTHHILGVDMKYKVFFAAHGVPQDPTPVSGA
jgi:hemerythrin-like metal-binding protein